MFLESRLVPAPVLERAQSIEARLKGASARVRELRDSVLLALDRALALQARVNGASKLIAMQQERVRAHRIKTEEAPLWRLDADRTQFKDAATELSAAWRVLRDYLAADGVALGALFLAVLAATGWLFTRGAGHDVPAVQRAYGRPLAAALLVALMLLMWLAPDPPLLFYEALLLLVPIPAARIARRVLPAPIPMTLYGLALATMLLPLRSAVSASAVGDRLLLLLQAISIGVPVAIDLGRGRLREAFPRVSPGLLRMLALWVILVSGLAVFSVVFGFAGPVKAVRSGAGSILGFGLVFGTTALALYGATLALLASPAAQWLRSARGPDPALLRAVRWILTALAIAGVVLVALGSLGLVPTLRSSFNSLMDATLEVGTVSIAARAVAMALAVVFATIVLTGVTGFVLDREVVPRLQLRPGAGYAVVTFTRWSMILVGAALTMAALGIDTTKVTLVAGALSVGIGFGLQNVVNNFVSGLILIVERPVGVGDLIEVGPLTGEVKRIGIRSSTVRTGQGAEVIVPNGNLVSKEVVNWTRSDRQRRYDIDVGVAPDSDPEQVMRLLVEAAGEVPEIITDPPPRAMFKGFGDSSLDFRLLAWVRSVDLGLQAQNALRVAILRKLESAGIAIPPRDLRVQAASVGERPATG